MKNLKNEKGISLIVIVILAAIIVALGSIAAVIIIGNAQEKVGNNKINNIADNQTNTQKNEQQVEKKTTVQGTGVASVTNEGVPIPKGFKYVEGSIDTGLVIENETEGSQFVWVPVNEEIVENNSVIFNEPNIVTGVESYGDDRASGEKYDAVEENLKLAGCVNDLNGDNKVDAYDFKEQLVNEFNSMKESVNKYFGYYISRYEVSINSEGNAQSKGSKEGSDIYSATGDESSANSWYGLYSLCKTYNTDSVKSSMVWGGQYDAMVTWAEETNESILINPDLVNTDNQKRTGISKTDVINNIYDLFGCCFEWTMSANSYHSRTFRGGCYMSPASLTSWKGEYPTTTADRISARLALYIEV